MQENVIDKFERGLNKILGDLQSDEDTAAIASYFMIEY